MNCQYCGREVGLSFIATGDWDFCSPCHRVEFHNRLRKGMALLGDASPQALRTAGPRPVMRPCDGSSVVSLLHSGPIGYAYAHLMRLPRLTLTIDVETLRNETADTQTTAVIVSNKRALVSASHVESGKPSKVPGRNSCGRAGSGATVVDSAKLDRPSELLARLDQLRRNLEYAAGSERQFATA